MTIARHYVMRAPAGGEAALEAVLRELATAVRVIPGNQGVDLMHDGKDAQRFVFIEKWDSVEAHKAGGAQLPGDLMGRLMAAIDGKPEGATLACLPLT